MTFSAVFRYCVIIFGCFLSSAAVNTFLVPAHLLSSGLAGIAIIFYFLFSLPIGAQVMVYNLPLLFAAYKTLSREYIVDVIFGTIMFSVMLDATKFMSAYALLSDPMLSAIFGGTLTGLGYGLIFRMNASSGGIDIVAAIVKKYYSFNMGGVIFAINCVIMAFAALLFGLAPALYTLISIYISSSVTDMVVDGFNHRKVLLIISEQPEHIAEAIIHEVGRGVTFLDGEGAFTHQQRRVLFVVASLTQIAKLKLLVNVFDKNAFMIVMSANEVMGRGFTLPGKKIEQILEERKSAEKGKVDF